MPATFVVIEGPDGVGKTTIARHLERTLNLEFVKFKNPKDEEDGKRQYFDFLETHTSGRYVLDRSWLGEWVYAPIFRGYTPSYWAEMEKKVVDSRARVLYLVPFATPERFASLPRADQPQELEGKNTLKLFQPLMDGFLRVYDRVRSGEKFMFNLDNYGTLDEELAFLTLFVMKWMNNDTVYTPLSNTYHYTMFNPDFRFVDGVMPVDRTCTCYHFKDHQQYDFWKARGSITWGSGSLDPEIVLIGEAPGWKGCGRTGIPFYNDKSGMFLRELLFWNRIGETEIYLTNILKCTPLNNKLNPLAVPVCSRHLASELRALKVKERLTPMIAIGRTAERVLVEQGYNPTYLKHPAAAFYDPTSASEYTKEFSRTVLGVMRRASERRGTQQNTMDRFV